MEGKHKSPSLHLAAQYLYHHLLLAYWSYDNNPRQERFDRDALEEFTKLAYLMGYELVRREEKEDEG